MGPFASAYAANSRKKKDPKIVKAGYRSALKTTLGGLMAYDKKTNRVLLFEVESKDLFSLAESLKRRENAR